MTRCLVARVTLEDPDTRQHVSFGPGEEVPGWASALITNPLAWAEGEQPTEVPVTEVDDGAEATVDSEHTETPEGEQPTEGDDAPPRSGAGSGVGAWAKHARALGVPVTDHMSRDDIIAAVDAL